MTVSQKVSVSLFISVLLFAAFSVLAFTGLFNLVETRFYNPAVTRGYERALTIDTEVTSEYFSALQTRFASILSEGAVQRSFLPNQSAEDIFERSRLFGLLLEEINGLQSVRFIDASGKRIHFSTQRADILKEDRLSMAYRTYGDGEGDLPFDRVSAAEGAGPRLQFDAARDRFLFIYPFTDSFKVYKGTALFSVSLRGLSERLIKEGRLRVGDDIGLVDSPMGSVAGLPQPGREALAKAIASVWQESAAGTPQRISSGTGSAFILMTARTRDGIFVSRLVSEGVFSFPAAMKAILLASFFFTTYLIVFLLFNLRQDSMTMIRERIKRLQISLVEEYYDRKGDLDWDRWTLELEQRRDEVKTELKHNLRNLRNADELIDKSWDELLASIGGARRQSAEPARIDEGKLEDILSRLLATHPVQVVASPAPKAPSKPAPAAPRPTAVSGGESADEVEEIEDLEEIEEVDEAEALEDLEEVAEAEAAEEIEEIGEAEAVEELEEVSEAEALEDLEEVAEAEAVEEIEEIGEAEAVDELEEVEEVEDASGATGVFDELEEVPEAAESEAVEEIEEIGEAEAVDELEEVEEVEDAGEVLEVGDLEDLEPGDTPAVLPGSEHLARIAAEFDTAIDVVNADDLAATEAFAPINPSGYNRTASNIRVVFGDDDIPYIVESSGIELVDDDLNSVMDFIDQGESAPIEELGAVPDEAEGDLEELISEVEDISFSEVAEEGTSKSSRPSEAEIEAIVSAIEFSPSPVREDDSPLPEWDVASPFDTILGEFFSAVPADNDVPAQAVILDDAELETLEEASFDGEGEAVLEPVDTLLSYSPFFSAPEEPDYLTSLPDELEAEAPSDLLPMEEESIEVKGGVAYITETTLKGSALDPDRFDPEMKRLVDSVLSHS